jgi:hypothetical protein
MELMLKNNEDPWFKHLLDNRYIVIIPMTNPHGYYQKIRVKIKKNLKLLIFLGRTFNRR